MSSIEEQIDRIIREKGQDWVLGALVSGILDDAKASGKANGKATKKAVTKLQPVPAVTPPPIWEVVGCDTNQNREWDQVFTADPEDSDQEPDSCQPAACNPVTTTETATDNEEDDDMETVETDIAYDPNFKPSTKTAQVWEALKAGTATAPAGLASATGVSLPMVSVALKKLLNAGWVNRTGSRRSVKYEARQV